MPDLPIDMSASNIPDVTAITAANHATLFPPYIVGGILLRKNNIPKASANITAQWQWYNESNGLVEWSFKNGSSEQVAFVLYRNSYLFCGAFGAAIYASNPGFGISYAASVVPLTDNGATNNTPPLGIVRWPNGTPEVCFVFVLAPGASYSMLEGGFSAIFPPSGAQVFEVTAPVPGSYCIGYSPAAVSQWNSQTGESLAGGPNPQAFDAIAWTLPADVPVTVPFPVTVGPGPCTGEPSPPTCSSYLTLAEQEFSNGQYLAAFESAVGFIECLLGNGSIETKTAAKTLIDALRRHL